MRVFFLMASIALTLSLRAQENKFNGLNTGLGNLYELSDAKTRSISPENYTGEKGKGGMAKPEDFDHRNAKAARELGQGWKINPAIIIPAGQTFTIAEIEGPGVIQHIWLTTASNWRFTIIRFYWDDETTPSVECPIGDFFCMGWGEFAPLNSLAVCVNPGSAFNCYWNMPFRKKCKITLENISDQNEARIFYQIDYALTDVPENAAYFHAQFRRTHYNESSDYMIVDGIKGKGQYVGVYMAWAPHRNGWWGEGEIKFFMDGDKQFPTICGTGVEDYFCGSFNFENKQTKQYQEFSTAYAGLHQVIRPDGVYKSQQRYGLYRWHIVDPIRFEKDMRITIQDLGYRHGGRYLQQKSDIASVVFWYQKEPHAAFPKLPSWQELEVN